MNTWVYASVFQMYGSPIFFCLPTVLSVSRLSQAKASLALRSITVVISANFRRLWQDSPCKGLGYSDEAFLILALSRTTNTSPWDGKKPSRLPCRLSEALCLALPTFHQTGDPYSLLPFSQSALSAYLAWISNGDKLGTSSWAYFRRILTQRSPQWHPSIESHWDGRGTASGKTNRNPGKISRDKIWLWTHTPYLCHKADTKVTSQLRCMAHENIIWMFPPWGTVTEQIQYFF